MRICRCKIDMVSPGVEEANRLNLETFIEATDLGKLTYEACGLVYAGTNYLETAKRNASPAWKGLERDMQYVYLLIDTKSRRPGTFWCCNALSGVSHLLDSFANSREAREMVYSGAMLTKLGRLSICIECGDPRAEDGWKERHSFPGRRTRRTEKRTNNHPQVRRPQKLKNSCLFRYGLRLREQSLKVMSSKLQMVNVDWNT